MSDPIKSDSPEGAVDPAAICSTFSVSAKDAQRIEDFTNSVNKERGSDYGGAIGGATTYEFTPTSIGLVFKVRHFGKELDLTNYDEW